ncbi:MAG TPA: hypothetical protein VNX68_03310, partial [Nitrosopumilaceae archaeon]|nr:hypothetical protein [Nitrosopumilaceae archaeon]
MRLSLFLLGLTLVAQPSFELITIVPVTDSTTGVKVTPGRIVIQDKQIPTHVIGFTAADSMSNDIVYKLWNTDIAGCVTSLGTTNGDGTKNLTIDPTCTGGSVTLYWSRDTHNDVYLTSGSDTLKSLTFYDQTPSTGSTNVIFKAAAGQSGPLIRFEDSMGNSVAGINEVGGFTTIVSLNRPISMQGTTIYLANTSTLQWNNAITVNGVPDVSFGWRGSGALEVYDGITHGTEKDLWVHNLFSDGGDIGAISGGFINGYYVNVRTQTLDIKTGTGEGIIGIDSGSGALAFKSTIATMFEMNPGGVNESYQELRPSANLTYDLGDSTHKWNNGWINTL